MFPLKFVVKIQNYEIILDEAKSDQTELGILINKLNNNYNPRIPKKVKEKNSALKSARKFLDVRKDIISFFEEGIFLCKGNVFKSKEEVSEEEESEEERIKKFIKHFKFLVPSALIKQLYETKKLVNVIKSGLSDLKDEIKEMSEDEKEIEKPDKILKDVEKILDFNNKQNQIGKSFKILTPTQMLSRLPITSAQLKAGNNSEKLKN